MMSRLRLRCQVALRLDLHGDGHLIDCPAGTDVIAVTWNGHHPFEEFLADGKMAVVKPVSHKERIAPPGVGMNHFPAIPRKTRPTGKAPKGLKRALKVDGNVPYRNGRPGSETDAMERDEQELLTMLKANGAVPVRSKKHHVWRLPDGRSFTFSRTPSCPRSYRNAMMDLRRMLGQTPTVAVIGERREKKRKAEPKRKAWEGFERTEVPKVKGLAALANFRIELPETEFTPVIVPKSPLEVWVAKLSRLLDKLRL